MPAQTEDIARLVALVFETAGELRRLGEREARAVGVQGLSDWLHAQRAHRPSIPDMVAKALAAAQAQTMVLPGEATSAQLINQLARDLLDLDRRIKDLGKQLTNAEAVAA